MHIPLRRTSGFSLIEVMLVGVIVSLLIALAIPGVSRARTRAHHGVMLSALRSHAAVLHQYADQYREYAPWFTEPRPVISVVRCQSREFATTCRYFEASDYWNVALADAFYDGRFDGPEFHLPYPPASRIPGAFVPVGSPYKLPCSFAASPEFWDLSTRESLPRQLRGVRFAEVLYPSAKSLLVFPDHWYAQAHPRDPRATLLAFVDGHADLVPATRWIGDCPGGDQPGGLDYTMHLISEPAMVHTRDGVRGRDISP